MSSAGLSDASVSLRVLVVHDYLTQRGGAERVALALLQAFPGARMITSVYDPDRTFPEFQDHDVETMYVGRVPLLRTDPRRALPLLAHAFSSYDVGDADVVVASSSGWAHGLSSDVPKVIYCHNPARWLYQAEDYLLGRPPWVRKAFSRGTRRLRDWDQRSAHTSAMYFANSTAVKGRIANVYGIDAALLPPPASLGVDGPQDPVPGIEPGFLLTVARARAYKNTAVACDAVAAMPGARLIAVGGLPEGGAWPGRVQGMRNMTDAQMRWLYASCSGVIAVSHEDFGLTPIEGYSFGKPAVVLKAGGYLDSSAPSVASVFVDEATLGSVHGGIRELQARAWNADAIRKHGELFAVEPFQERIREAVASVAVQPRSPRLVHKRPRNSGGPQRRKGDTEFTSSF